MAIEQLKPFLHQITYNQELPKAIRKAATVNEIEEIASTFGYEFSGNELRAIANESIPGVKIKETRLFSLIGLLGKWQLKAKDYF